MTQEELRNELNNANPTGPSMLINRLYSLDRHSSDSNLDIPLHNFFTAKKKNFIDYIIVVVVVVGPSYGLLGVTYAVYMALFIKFVKV